LSSGAKVGIIGGGCGGLLVVFILCAGVLSLVGKQMKETAKKDVAEANRLWEAGDKAQAVAKYKSLIENRFHSMDDSDKPVVFKRAIEFDVEQKNETSARQLIKKAEEEKITLSLDGPAYWVMLRVQQEKEKEQEQKEIADAKHGSVMDEKKMRDFADSTGSYKGKTVTMRLDYLARDPLTQAEVDGIANTLVPFKGHGIVNGGFFSFDISLVLPKGIKVPRLNLGDDVIVTFVCSQGELGTGNRVKKITRP
jgi:hypothetical protein